MSEHELELIYDQEKAVALLEVGFTGCRARAALWSQSTGRTRDTWCHMWRPQDTERLRLAQACHSLPERRVKSVIWRRWIGWSRARAASKAGLGVVDLFLLLLETSTPYASRSVMNNIVF
jgi:hypothetical protein